MAGKRKAKTMAVKVKLKDLLEAGVHFGHQSRRWHPKMKSYLYDVRDGIHIIDLAKTKEYLEAACAFVKATAAEGGQIVFVGTKRQAQAIVAEEAKKAGFPYVSQRWLGGLISNWEQIKASITKLVEMTEKRKKGDYKKYTKKEQLLLDRQISRLEKLFGGLIDLKKTPEAIFVVDVKKEQAAVNEARRKGVKVVAVVDSNSDPTPVDYVIPANDDAVGSIKMVVSTLAQAAKEGREVWKKKNKK
jgi:small subunit ribosomal protein S2